MTLQKPTTMPQTGDEAPDFSFPSPDSGKSPSSKDMLGTSFVLYFYPKDNTSGCTQEAIDFTQLRPEFDKIGVKIIGVSPDSAASHQKFVQKHDLKLDLIPDESLKILQDYGVWVEKSMYGRKYMGVERTTFLIDAEGKIAHVWNKVKVKGHAQAVLEAAQNL